VQDDPVAAAVWAVILFVIVAAIVASTFQKRGKGGGGSAPGPAAAGAIYDLLNQDKRNAIEIIVEEKAAARDPEDADGNLPDLQDPKRRR
jgi:TRAP-type uncharacterized transport system fused permease subunit